MKIADLEVKKELANSLTHLFGILFGIVSMPVLIAYAIQSGNPLAVIGSCVFGFSFLMVFTSSTLYHSISEPGIKAVLRTLDHISIYFLIAGSYTPFVLLYMFDDRGILLLCMQWGLTLIGIVFKFFYAAKFNLLSTLVYVLMGWLVVLFPSDLLSRMSDEVFNMVALGGLSYSIGVVFYLWKRLDYHHAIWHAFVLGGSISHYVAILLLIQS